MGTFTVGYFVRKAFWEKKHYWTASVAAYWIGMLIFIFRIKWQESIP